jgi:hypothetical protein
MAGTFGWTDNNTCAIKICAYETPFHLMLNLKFDGDQVTLNSELNVGFDATKHPELIGRAE